MTKLAICGFDPSLRNWGIAVGAYCIDTGKLEIPYVAVVQPVLSTAKQVRQNSLDIESGMQLFQAAYKHAKEAQVVFIEVPVGSQSARAMASYGLCVGIIGSIKGLGIPVMEMNPMEVKVTATGSKTATKEQMIACATQRHPEANWPRRNLKGISHISEAKAEHMADAIGAIYAGIASNSFIQLLTTLKRTNHANPSYTS
jgi:Holliday junction resolvasome RuvABC endonuclease subunit